MSLERKFFKIANVFMIIAATIALFSAIGGAIYGLSLQNSRVHTVVTQPTTSYSSLKNEKSALKAQKKAKAEAAAIAPTRPATPEITPPTEDDEEVIPLEEKNIINRIESSIDIFTSKTGQPKTKSKIRSNIYHAAKEFERFIPVTHTLLALETEAKALENDAINIAQLQKSDEEYIEWPAFLSFFFNSYKRSINTQLQTIEREKAEVEANKIQSYLVFTWAGGSFGSFIFITIILLLFSIDKNIHAIRHELCPQSHKEGTEA